MAGASILNRFDPARLARLADGLAVAVAVSLPWSTSATSILIVLWLIALIPTLNWADLRRKLVTPAGGLPVLLVLLGVLGMLWADVTWAERWNGLGSFFKLLVVPLLLVQFRRSDRGQLVIAAYVVSCAVLVVMSSVFAVWPDATFLFTQDYGVPVKNAATQSGEFVTCIFGLLYVAFEMLERGRRMMMVGLLLLVAGFFANIAFVATARTPLVIIPLLLVLLGLKKFNVRGAILLVVVGVLFAAAAWVSSSYLRARVMETFGEIRAYRAQDVRNSPGERLEFAKKSIEFISEAPLIGHGTGTIPDLFRRSAVGQAGASAVATTNPHNQTFAVAIQLGLVGAVVLWAMWIAHLLLFRGHGLAEWIGLVVVVQNIVGSLFNSHLFDFGQGWVYVFGVGIAGGMALKNRAAQKPAGAAT
jgi:hypothetical protein